VRWDKPYECTSMDCALG